MTDAQETLLAEWWRQQTPCDNCGDCCRAGQCGYMAGGAGPCPMLFPAAGRWWCAAIYHGTAENRLRSGILRRGIIHGLEVAFGCGCTNPFREDGPLGNSEERMRYAITRELPAPNVFELRARHEPDWPLPPAPRANWKPRRFFTGG